MILQTANKADQEAIHRLHLAAFDPSERDIVAQLAIDLLNTESSPNTHSFVAEVDECIVAHISFSPVWNAHSHEAIGYTLAPLAVSPSQQRKGIGKQLVEHGIAFLREQSVRLLLVYGDPNYYGRFGFERELAKDYEAPHPLKYDFGWQAMLLSSEQRVPEACKIECVAALDDSTLW